MSAFTQAMNNMSVTKNGGLTLASSGSLNLDWFMAGGSARQFPDIAKAKFLAALGENPETAIRILFYLRDVREGSGERSIFEQILGDLCREVHSPEHQAVVARILAKVPEIGRWSDLKVAFNTPMQRVVTKMFAVAIQAENGLAAKWTPRKGVVFESVRKYLHLTPKELRTALVALSNTVEQKVCARQFDQVDYEKLPSCASLRYAKSFHKNDSERYADYLAALEKGEAKVNAGAVYPYQIVAGVRKDRGLADAMWKKLPNLMEGCVERILPVIDVSSSMGVQVTNGVSAMDIAIAIGLYISENAPAPFKNEYISFSGSPNFHTVTGDKLDQRVESIRRSGEDCSTNVVGVFETLLKYAKSNNLKDSDMPTMLTIISDLEFNTQFDRNNYRYGRIGDANETKYRVTAMEAIKKLYAGSGYTMPKLVFWNVNSPSESNVPVRQDETGTILASGFSHNSVRTFMKGSLNPLQGMLDTVYVPRYDF